MEIVWLNVAILVGVLAVFALTIVAIYFRVSHQGVLFDPSETSKKDLTGQYAIITGGNSGIGFETARHLAYHGCYVVIACRSAERGNKAANEIENELHDNSNKNIIHKGGKCKFMQCDLASLESVKNFYNEYINTNKYPLNILINNAGMGYHKSKFTRQDKFPLVWQVNFLSHFYLTHLLLPTLLKTAKESNLIGRIVNVSSLWHKYGIIDFDKYNRNDEKEFAKDYYHKEHYGQSKLAQIMHATYLQKQLFNKYNLPLIAVSLHPGAVNTNIFKWDSMPFFKRMVFRLIYPWFLLAFRTCKQGAQTQIFCSMGEIGSQKDNNNAVKINGGYELVPGAYHINMQPSYTQDKLVQSTNEKEMKKLWDYCYKKLNINQMIYDTKSQTLV